jgi:hypothetical protein
VSEAIRRCAHGLYLLLHWRAWDLSNMAAPVRMADRRMMMVVTRTCLHAGRGLPTRARDFLVHQCAYHKSLKHTHTHIDYVAQSSYLSTYGLLYRSNYYVANRRCASIHHSPYRKQPANSDPYPADTCPSPPIPAYVTMSASTIGGAFVTSSYSGRQCKHRQGWQPWCADSDRGFSIYATSHAGTRTNAADAASPWIRSN